MASRRGGGAARHGDHAWSKIPKISSELFSLTYGAMVVQLIKDFEDVGAVNQQLEKMGYNIGIRLIDEFLAKSGISDCQDFRETADVIAKVAFKMFLGISADITSWNADSTAFSLLLYENPLSECVELPPQHSQLLYSNVLCGVIRGALEMVQLRVECRFVRDVLRGDDVNEIRIELKEVLEDEMSSEYAES